VDYCRKTLRDPLRTTACVRRRIAMIEKNLKLMQ
jgi:IS1 family transposase